MHTDFQFRTKHRLGVYQPQPAYITSLEYQHDHLLCSIIERGFRIKEGGSCVFQYGRHLLTRFALFLSLTFSSNQLVIFVPTMDKAGANGSDLLQHITHDLDSQLLHKRTQLVLFILVVSFSSLLHWYQPKSTETVTN